MITQDRLKELLSHDPETGIFRWIKKPSKQISAGAIAGSVDRSGHVRIRVEGQRYLAHRLAWPWQHGTWPNSDIDHIDGNPANNSIRNLRCADCSLNMANSKRARNNTSGFKGVSWHRLEKKFQASIKVRGKFIWLGRFSSAEDAHAAYAEAAKTHFGEYARVA